MKIAMTGATGFVGRHLGESLRKKGHQVTAISRQDFARGAAHLVSRLWGSEVVINLAGAPINKRWTPAYKRELVASRVDTTRVLVEAMGQMEPHPELFISTSAIGAFDSAGHYTEDDDPNAIDFLGDLSRDWEVEARLAESHGIRTLIFRFGLVLGHDGGMMKQLLLPFRLGLGGPVGDGTQAFSWVHIDDLVAAYHHALAHEELSRVYHVCAPNPVSNGEFTRLLGHTLNRPTVFRVPGAMLKLIYGEGADVMTSGQWVTSKRLPEAGFVFKHPALESALKAIADRAEPWCPFTGETSPDH